MPRTKRFLRPYVHDKDSTKIEKLPQFCAKFQTKGQFSFIFGVITLKKILLQDLRSQSGFLFKIFIQVKAKEGAEE